MRNFIISIVLIAIIAGILQSFFPWWVVAIAAFIIGYFVKQNAFAAFAAGFISVFIVWVVYAYMLSSANEHLLVGKVAELMKDLTKGSVTTLFIMTGVVGGLVAGFAALTGRLAAQLSK